MAESRCAGKFFGIARTDAPLKTHFFCCRFPHSVCKAADLIFSSFTNWFSASLRHGSALTIRVESSLSESSSSTDDISSGRRVEATRFFWASVHDRFSFAAVSRRTAFWWHTHTTQYQALATQRDFNSNWTPFSRGSLYSPFVVSFHSSEQPVLE